MRDQTATVIENRQLNRDTFLLGLEVDLGAWRAGQFVMLKVSNGLEPFLRRPFGILASDNGRVYLYYKVKGTGTRAMSTLLPGAKVDLLGPLGNGFPDCPDERTPIMVAGGTGLPPIMALARSLGRGELFLGARDAIEIPLIEEVRALAGVRTEFATEDGSLGHQGFITELLRSRLELDAGSSQIYACGPLGMLKAVAQLAAEYAAPCLVSLEERMGCGFGVCAGCVVTTVDGQKRVCKEGPVFKAEDLTWGQP